MKKLIALTLTSVWALCLTATSNAQDLNVTNTIAISGVKTPTAGCPGDYRGYTKITNSLGSVWVIPPTNATQVTFTDVTGAPAPYNARLSITRFSDKVTWCDSNSIVIAVTGSTRYQFSAYVKTPSPSTATNQTVALTVHWD